MGGNVCGYTWNVTEDIMGVKFPVNLSKKKRSVRSEPDLTLADIEKLKTMHVCKRNILGLSMVSVTHWGWISLVHETEATYEGVVSSGEASFMG